MNSRPAHPSILRRRPIISALVGAVCLAMAGCEAPKKKLEHTVPSKIIMLGLVQAFDPGGQDIQTFLDDEVRRCHAMWTDRTLSWSITKKPLWAKPEPGTPGKDINIGAETDVVFTETETDRVAYRFRTVQFVTNDKVLMIARARPEDLAALPTSDLREQVYDGVRGWAINLSNGETGCVRAG